MTTPARKGAGPRREILYGLSERKGGWFLFHPYPEQFPGAAVVYLIPILRGKQPDDVHLAANAVYALTGYGLSIAAQTGVTVRDDAVSATPLEVEAAVNLLERLAGEHQGCVDVKTESTQIPWGQLLLLLWPILQQYLQNKFPKFPLVRANACCPHHDETVAVADPGISQD